MEIYVDADACPVKQEVLRVAHRHELTVYFVSNQWLRMDNHPRVNVVVVPEGPDEADNWIAERAGEYDIVITADIPLADRCIKRGAKVLRPSGKPFSEDNIGMSLATRNLLAHLRETSDHKTNNPAFTQKDRSRFLVALENAIWA